MTNAACSEAPLPARSVRPHRALSHFTIVPRLVVLIIVTGVITGLAAAGLFVGVRGRPAR
jgi:hypothetical protein